MFASRSTRFIVRDNHLVNHRHIADRDTRQCCVLQSAGDRILWK